VRPDSAAFDAVSAVFERALVFQHRMPLIWVA
jgi:pre-mRNA-splicing factor SYF1